MKEYLILSSRNLFNNLLKIHLLRARKSMENQKQVPISIECPRFNIQKSHQILQFNVSFPLQINPLRCKSFNIQRSLIEFVTNLIQPMVLRFNVRPYELLITTFKALS